LIEVNSIINEENGDSKMFYLNVDNYILIPPGLN